MLNFLNRSKPNKSIILNVVDDNYIIDFCLEWSHRFPIDRWWRERHGVAFNSPEHRESSFFDMRFEFEEYLLLKDSRANNTYVANTGDYLKAEPMVDYSNLTEEQRRAKYLEESKEIDLSQYDE